MSPLGGGDEASFRTGEACTGPPSPRLRGDASRMVQRGEPPVIPGDAPRNHRRRADP